MPINISGSISGQTTTDATATPSDVWSGKSFYGANGKQTGIMQLSATAKESDVLKGKTFYSADRNKKTGTLEFPYKCVEVTFRDCTSIKNWSPVGGSGKISYTVVNPDMTDAQYSVSGWVLGKYVEYKISGDFIGFEIRGKSFGYYHQANETGGVYVRDYRTDERLLDVIWIIDDRTRLFYDYNPKEDPDRFVDRMLVYYK